jgi:hypothetical protein
MYQEVQILTTQRKVITALLIIVVWVGALLTVDKVFNKHPETTRPAALTATPHLRITFTHFCCNGCYSSLFKTTQQFSWLSNPTVDQKQLVSPKEAENMAHHEGEDDSGSATMELNPHQIFEVDFVKLDRALRENGLRPQKIEMIGIPHFSLIGQHAHLCCGICTTAATSAFMLNNTPSEEMKTLKMAKPPEISAIKDGYGDIVADIHAGESDPKDPFKNAVDITAFMQALEKAGTLPNAITILPLQ